MAIPFVEEAVDLHSVCAALPPGDPQPAPWRRMAIDAVRFPPTLAKSLHASGCKTLGDVADIEPAMAVLRGFTKKHRETVQKVLAVFRG